MTISKFLQLMFIYAVPLSGLILAISLLERRPFFKTLAVVVSSIAIIAIVLYLNTAKLITIPGQTMNWGGHTLMALPFLIFVVIKGKRYAYEIGLTKAAGVSHYVAGAMIGLLICLIGLVIAKPMAPEPFWEKLAFQLTLPGFSEELIFRGVLLGLLNQHFGKRFLIKGTSFGWGLFLVSVPFALGHVFRPAENSMEIMLALGIATYTFIASCLFGFIREQSKSLWPSIFSHNASNVIELLISKFLLG